MRVSETVTRWIDDVSSRGTAETRVDEQIMKIKTASLTPQGAVCSSFVLSLEVSQLSAYIMNMPIVIAAKGK